MVNRNLRILAQQLGNEMLADTCFPELQLRPVSFPPEPLNPFLLDYGHAFCQDLLRVSNAMFVGTAAEVPIRREDPVGEASILHRLALTTALYHRPAVQQSLRWPITPFQAEALLERGGLPFPLEKHCEDLALVVYDTRHPNEDEAKALHQALSDRRQELGLAKKDLGSLLLVVNAGLEKDHSMPLGVRPVVLPGLTRAYPEIPLKRLVLPSPTECTGLRVLSQHTDGQFYMNFPFLTGAGKENQLTFASQSSS